MIPEGRVVYHMAGLGVVLDVENRTQTVFSEHTDDITAFSLHPSSLCAATGEAGRHPKVHVWDTTSCALLYTLSSEKLQKGISDLAFSPSGKMLCVTAMDDNHEMVVFSTESHMPLFSAETGPDDLCDISFLTETEIVTVGIKHYKYWKIESGLKSHRGIFGDQCNVLFCAGINNRDVYTGAQDGSVIKWNENQIVKAVKVHEKQVDAIWVDASGVITGGKDGVIVFSDFELTKLKSVSLAGACSGSLNTSLRTIQQLESGRLLIGTFASEIYDLDQSGKSGTLLVSGHFTPSRKHTVTNEVWGLAVYSDSQHYVTGSDDGTIRLWNIAEKRCVRTVSLVSDRKGEVPDSAKPRALGLSPDNSLLAVGCKSGLVQVYSTANWTLAGSSDRQKEEISDVKFSPDGSKLAVGGHDNLIILYAASGLRELGVLRGHNSYITHLDWSCDGKALHSNCGAYELLFWDVETCSQQPGGATTFKDEKWESWTSVVGWPVQGVYPAYSDGTDVNSVDRTRKLFGRDEYEVVAVADDFSQVKLFRFPCLQRNAKAVEGRGHSSHVTCVRFTPDSNYLISTGGDDQAVIQWRVTPE